MGKMLKYSILVLIYLFIFNPTPGFSQTIQTSQSKQIEKEFSFAKALFDDGLYPVAKEQFERYLRKYPSSIHRSEVTYMLGESLFQIGDYKNSITVFNQFMFRAPIKVFKERALFRLGEAQFRSDKFNEALETFDNFTNQFPIS